MRTDVVIIGAGPAGLLLARLPAQDGTALAYSDTALRRVWRCEHFTASSRGEHRP